MKALRRWEATIAGRTFVAYAKTAKAARELIARHMCCPPRGVVVTWAPFDEMVVSMVDGRAAPGA